MASEHAQLSPAFDVPNSGGPVLGGGDDPLAIGRKGEGCNPFLMPNELLDQLACRGIPDFGGAFKACGCQQMSVRRERNAADHIRVHLKHTRDLRLRSVPKLDSCGLLSQIPTAIWSEVAGGQKGVI